MTRFVADGFAQFMELIDFSVPPNPMQVLVMKKVFYAGVFWGVVKVPELLSSGEECTPGDVLIMQFIRDELLAFFKEHKGV